MTEKNPEYDEEILLTDYVRIVIAEIRARARLTLPIAVRLMLMQTAATDVAIAVFHAEEWVGAQGGLQYNATTGEWE